MWQRAPSWSPTIPTADTKYTWPCEPPGFLGRFVIVYVCVDRVDFHLVTHTSIQCSIISFAGLLSTHQSVIKADTILEPLLYADLHPILERRGVIMTNSLTLQKLVQIPH